jgi:hypothetical protein
LALVREHLVEDLQNMREYLALGDISAVEHHITEALDAFQINLDRESAAYPKLGIEVLRAYVRALQDIERRNAGEPVSTPPLPTAPSTAASGKGLCVQEDHSVALGQRKISASDPASTWWPGER